MNRRICSIAIAGLLTACGASQPQPAQRGSIKDVVVVLKGSDEPLPFDPRGGRITVVTGEIKNLIGHHVVLELDSALSPELKSSFEESVLASFETIARELVVLQKEDPEMFLRAKRIERVLFTYDAVLKESEGVLEGDKLLRVKAPPDHFPLLEKWILSQAVYDAHITDLDARWGDADPTRLSPRERAPYFAYMTKTRAGAGYLWTVARRKKTPSASNDDTPRVEHVGRIVKLAGVVSPQEAALSRKIRAFLLEQLHFLGGFRASPDYAFKAEASLLSRVLTDYERWLNQNQASFDDEERLKLARAIYSGSGGHPEVAFPGFDRFAFGMNVYDTWANEGAKNELPPGPRGELYKLVVCPSQRRGEGETEIKWGCSSFFSLSISDDAMRARLAEAIVKRKDTKLLETALFNHPHNGGEKTLALVESLPEPLFHHGFSVLFHDLARVDDVKNALERSATRWWRDAPSRRGLALLVMARQTEGLHVHYGDNHWTRFVAEYGGPIRRDVFSAYLAEGARAVEMSPKIWLALAKGSERDDLIAKSIPALLERDRQARTSKASGTLALLRTRLCDEKNASGLTMIKASIDRWALEHPQEAASVSNARADFTLTRCKEPPKVAGD